ncbi:MAG TPA: Fe-S cluster assembly protein SufB, partial [Rhodothermales bacterium]|nr:Fe-S cluster assembly protein SufB [Rhodothermales bacterium]
MTSDTAILHEVADRDYEWGFVTEIDSETAPVGLTEDTVRLISSKKDEPAWLLEWRLKAFRHFVSLWEKQEEKYPIWTLLNYKIPDFQAISYYSAPQSKPKYNSLDEVDPELLRTFERLGIPLMEQERLVGVAVDVVMDSVSVHTTFKE